MIKDSIIIRNLKQKVKIFNEVFDMAILDILKFPDPRLRTQAKPVTQFDAQLKKLSEDMLETMYAAPGIGLAATQINVHKRLLVMDVSEDKSQPRVLINPEIVASGGLEEMDEGCLSVPGFYESVQRAETIRVRAQQVDGTFYEFDSEGLEAVCVQHEMDHLEGKLFVDYISALKRNRIRKKLEKQHKNSTAAPTKAAI